MIDRNDCKVACMQTFSAEWLLSKANMSHSWFFDNIVAARTMKILVDIFSKSTIFVAILLFCRATSYSSHCSFVMVLLLYFVSCMRCGTFRFPADITLGERTVLTTPGNWIFIEDCLELI